MWISIHHVPVPTYGKHGKEFLLNLQYSEYFGHNNNKTNEVVAAIWDSVEECFFEKHTGLAILEEDIVEWFKEI